MSGGRKGHLGLLFLMKSQAIAYLGVNLANGNSFLLPGYDGQLGL